MIADRKQSQAHHGDSDPQWSFFTKPRLQSLKATATWCGVLVTFGGIVLGVKTGGSMEAAGVAALGLLLTCCGHWISIAIAKHDAAERDADRRRFEQLESQLESSEEEKESMSDFLNQAGVFDDPKALRRVIQKEAGDYADRHQDDGR